MQDFKRALDLNQGRPTRGPPRFWSGPRLTSYIGLLIGPYALTRYCELQMRVLDFYFMGYLENTTKSIGTCGLKTFFLLFGWRIWGKKPTQS